MSSRWKSCLGSRLFAKLIRWSYDDEDQTVSYAYTDGLQVTITAVSLTGMSGR